MKFLLKEKLSRVKMVHNDVRQYLTMLDKIDVEDIHYGLYKTKDDSAKTAQKNLSELMLSLIPKGASLVLDVGGGIGAFSEELGKNGFRAACIVPDKKLITFGQSKFPKVNFVHGSAEYFKLKDKYDAAVLLESFGYFSDKKRAMKNIADHLHAKSALVIAEEFSNTPLPHPFQGIPVERDLIHLAESAGFRLVKDMDITKDVLPTCDFVTNSFSDKISSIGTVWQLRKKYYTEGQASYKVLVFERGA